MEPQVERITFRKKEAAEMLGLCIRTLENMIAADELTARKFGRSVIIPAGAVYGLMFCPVPRNSVSRIAFSRKEAAYSLGLSVRTIDNLIAAGELKIHKVRGRVLISVTTLRAFVGKDRKTKREAA